MDRLAFIAVFFMLTMLPAAQTIVGIFPEPIVAENRNLAPAPTSATPTYYLPKVADRWFGDHFGFRPLLIKIKAQIDYSLFGTSDRVLMGRDGQLFYRHTVNDEVPAMERLLDAKGAELVEGVEAISNALKERGIGTAVVVNQMVEKFYPELLPRNAVPRRANSSIDRTIDSLRHTPSIIFVDATSILRQTMKVRRTFLKTDFHWNDPAGFDIAKDLVARISAAEGRPQSIWNHPLEINEVVLSGGVATFMPLFFPPTELCPLVKQSWQWPSEFKQTINEGFFENVTTIRLTDKALASVAIVGDSYFDAVLQNGFQIYFNHTVRARWKAGMKMSDIVSNLPDDTRWFVLQFLEVSMIAVGALTDQDDIAESVRLIRKRPMTPYSQKAL